MCTENLSLRDYLGNSTPAVMNDTDEVDGAIRYMEKKRTHALLVTSKGKVAGIFTMGDFLRRVIGNSMNPKDTALSDVMTVDPLCFLPDTTVRKAFEICEEKGLSHIPVADEKHQPCGLLSMETVAHDLYEDLQEKSDECRWLRAYISGEHYALCA